MEDFSRETGFGLNGRGFGIQKQALNLAVSLFFFFGQTSLFEGL